MSKLKSPRESSTPVNNLIPTLANPGTATSKPFNAAMAQPTFVLSGFPHYKQYLMYS